MGTRFVSAAESPVHANYKQAIVDAEVTGTHVLNKKASPCIRALKTQRTAGIHEAGLMPPDTFSRILELYFGGDMEAAVGLAGQTAGLIGEVKTCREIIEETVSEFFEITSRLGRLAAARSFGESPAPALAAAE
jgi:enoyl-[acyl-carrier protein] reductase II